MQFNEFVLKAKLVQDRYDSVNNPTWTAAEYVQGLMGDVGDLAKLVLAKNQFRNIENIDQKLQHELADCLWAILVIANELNIDLEQTYPVQMDALLSRLDLNPG